MNEVNDWPLQLEQCFSSKNCHDPPLQTSEVLWPPEQKIRDLWGKSHQNLDNSISSYSTMTRFRTPVLTDDAKFHIRMSSVPKVPWWEHWGSRSAHKLVIWVSLDVSSKRRSHRFVTSGRFRFRLTELSLLRLEDTFTTPIGGLPSLSGSRVQPHSDRWERIGLSEHGAS